MKRWIYYAVAILLVVVYYLGEATGLLIPAMFIILPLRWWAIGNIYD